MTVADPSSRLTWRSILPSAATSTSTTTTQRVSSERRYSAPTERTTTGNSSNVHRDLNSSKSSLGSDSSGDFGLSDSGTGGGSTASGNSGTKNNTGSERRKKKLRRRRPTHRHTIDNAVSTTKSPSSPTPLSPKSPTSSTGGDPPRQLHRGASLLMRFLASTTSSSRRRSQTSGESSTVSRLTDDGDESAGGCGGTTPKPITRRATIDNDFTTMTTTAPPESGRSLMEENQPKRATMDHALTSSSHHRSPTGRGSAASGGGNIITNSRWEKQNEYCQLQTRLQRKADDFHKGGQLEKAIEVWMRALQLAEEHLDTLAKKTELMCILVDLHLQAAMQQLQHHSLGFSNFLSNTTKCREDAEEEAHCHQMAAKRYVHRIKPALVQPHWLGAPTPYVMDFFCQAEAWELALVVADQLLLEEEEHAANISVSRRHIYIPGGTGTGTKDDTNNNNDDNVTKQRRITPQQLAIMHFQVASQKLDRNRQGEALQHLQATAKFLQQVPAPVRDMVLYVRVLELLATEYRSQSQYQLAYDVYQELVIHTSTIDYSKHASLYIQMAEVCIAQQKLNDALKVLQKAAKYVEEGSNTSTSTDNNTAANTNKNNNIRNGGTGTPKKPSSSSSLLVPSSSQQAASSSPSASASASASAASTIRLQLLQTKGDVFCRLGRMEESLEVYQQAFHEISHTNNNPAERAKLLYTMGRLCIRLRRIRPAITYFTRELEITQSELGQNHLSVSRVLHELARLYDEGLGESKMALMKLNKALNCELAVLQDCQHSITQCTNCNPVTHRMCVHHASAMKDVSVQIRETKKLQGRIHYKLGDIDKALKVSLHNANNPNDITYCTPTTTSSSNSPTSITTTTKKPSSSKSTSSKSSSLLSSASNHKERN